MTLQRLVATALAALVLLAVERTGLAQDAVSFPANDADLTRGAPTMLEGLLYRPAGNGPFPALVVLHGCGGLYRNDGSLVGRHDAWARLLVSEGYITLLVDSFGPRGVRQICTVKEPTVRPAFERARDAYGALRYLQSRNDVDPGRIGLFGWSNGGSTVLWTLDDAIRARPIDLPGADFRVAVAFYPGCTSLLRRDHWRPIAPLLVLIGADDDWTPAEPCISLVERVRAAGADVGIVVYPDAYHVFDAPSTRLRVLQNIASTKSGTATVATNPQARRDALERVPRFLAERLKQ
jgi:dienelactone hydrolase